MQGGYPDAIFGGGEMSGAHGPKGLTRRSFLKTTGAAGVAAVAAGAAAPQLAAIAEGYEPCGRCKP